MNLRVNACTTAAACLLLIGTAAAQDASKPAGASSGAQVKAERKDDALQGRILRSTKMIGTKVKNAKGEKIGEVDDLVIDKGEGVVAYGILSFGGFLGIGEKLFAIPYGSLTRSGDDAVIVDLTKEQLESAPSFPKDAWFEFDRTYGAKVHEHYKATPYWQSDKTPTEAKALGKDALDAGNLRDHGMCRASKAIGMDVDDAAGKGLGDVDDLVIDGANGRIVYAVLSFGGFLGMGDKLFAIPWHALKPSAKDVDRLILDVPKEKLKDAPGFDKKDWPNMADQRWGLDIHKYYGQEPYWDAKERHDAKSGE
jgi:sporulation protein YlmC with PRC-barrel domain